MVESGKLDETFTAEARIVLVQAQVMAFRFTTPFTYPEHALLSLLTHSGSLAHQALHTLNVDSARARTTTEFIAKRYRTAFQGQQQGHEKRRLQPPPFAPPLRDVLDLAAKEVIRLGDGAIGTTHLLLALLQVDAGRVAILEGYGVTLARVYDVVAALPRHGEGIETTPEDVQHLTDLAQQMPGGVHRRPLPCRIWNRVWNKTGHFVRYYPLPFLIIGVWFVYAFTYRSVSGPGLATTTLATLGLRVLVVVSALQLIVTPWRRQFLYFAQQHRLAAGWMTMIVIRVGLGAFVPITQGDTQTYLMNAQTLALDMWLIVWIILLVRSVVTGNRRAKQRWAI